MLAAAKKYFSGLVGLGVFALLGKAVYAGASTGDLLGAGVAGVALALGAFLVTSAVPD